MSMVEKILITGGAGFIGSNLCGFLMNKGSGVVCLDNFDDFYSEEIKRKNINGLVNSPLFELIEGDIRDTRLLQTIFSNNQIKLVIHLAAKAGVINSIANPKEYFDVNVNGSASLFEVMNKHNVRNLIFSSSSSVYGNIEKKLSETDMCENQISPYAETKRTVEKLSYKYHTDSSFNVINLRLFSVYGERQRPDLVLHKFLNNIVNNEPIQVYGGGNTTRDYTYISDVVNAFNASIELLINTNEAIYEIINIGNDYPVSLNMLIDLISSTTMTSHIQIIKKDFVQGDVNNTHADISKAKKLLNYNPETTIKQGIEQFHKWFQENQIVK